MTEARKEYLKYCPVHERFCREELRISANRIKNLKRELTLQMEISNKVEENNQKYYDGFVQVTKAFLMMEKARYRAIKRLLPKRKPAKKYNVINSTIKGYWKIVELREDYPLVGMCSICGKVVGGGTRKLIERLSTCPRCGFPMEAREEEE